MSSANSKGACISDDKGRIYNAAGAITSGPIDSGNWTPTKATVAGFAGATSFTVTNARYFRIGDRVSLQVAGTWVPNAATSSGTITVPSGLTPPIGSGVTKTFIGEMLLNPSNQGTGVGAVTTTLAFGATAATSLSNTISLATTNAGTSNIGTSTFFLTGSYNLTS